MARACDRNVFINGPFDSAYRPLFEAVAFAVYDCGFYPRCAREVDGSPPVRIEKITAITRQCRLAIHERRTRAEIDLCERDTRALLPAAPATRLQEGSRRPESVDPT